MTIQKANFFPHPRRCGGKELPVPRGTSWPFHCQQKIAPLEIQTAEKRTAEPLPDPNLNGLLPELRNSSPAKYLRGGKRI
jgi:hypothetical protein